MRRFSTRAEIIRSHATSLTDFVDCCVCEGGCYYDYEPHLLEGDGRLALLVSHSLGLDGAPIVLLHAAYVLKRMGLRVLLASPKDGPLRSEAKLRGVAVLVAPLLKRPELVLNAGNFASFVMANTIETSAVVSALNGTDVPVLWWVHEAEACYSSRRVSLLPYVLFPNVTVLAGGPYARRSLLKRRPSYQVGELLYALPDRAAQTTHGHDEVPQAAGLAHGHTKRKTFALIGMLEPRKGQDILLAAIRRLPRNVKDACRFVFVGSAWNQRVAKAVYAAAAKSPELVSCVGTIPYKDLPAVYESIECLICASRDEPMSTTASEACMFSDLVICSDGAGMSELLRSYDAGLVFGNGNADELAASISRVCGAADGEFDGMRARARKLYESCFAEEVFERNMRRLIGQMVDHPVEIDAEQRKIADELREQARELAIAERHAYWMNDAPLWARPLYAATRWALLRFVLPVRHRLMAGHDL